MGVSVGTLTVWSNDATSGSGSWSTPEEAQITDDVYAGGSVSFLSSATKWLKGTGVSWDVPIPPGATILGVEVPVEWNGSRTGSGGNAAVRMVVADTPGTSEDVKAATDSGADSTSTFGSPTELWDGSLTPAVLNDSLTGAAIQLRLISGVAAVNVDRMGLICYWTAPAMRITSTTYLGRTKLGKKLSLVLQSIDANGTPTQPDVAPYADIYAGTTLVETVRLPIVERYKVDWLFGVDLFLGGKYSTGQHMIVYRWLLSGAKYQAFAYFEILAGGTVAGPVVAIAEYQKPEAHYLIQQTEDGTLNYGRNPQL